MPRGVRLCLDLGKARIGVAACDRDGLLAFPVETVAARPDPRVRIVELVEEYQPAAVVVGLPRTLAGTEGLAAADIRARAAEIAAAVDPVPVGLVDERLSTAAASKGLSAAGRTVRAQRGVVDQAAAVAILEGVLEADRGDGGRWQRVDPTEPGPREAT